MKKDVQPTKIFLSRYFIAIAAIGCIVVLWLLIFKKIKSPDGQDKKIESSPAASVMPSAQITSASTSTPYPRNFPPLGVNIDKIATFADRYFIHGNLDQNDALKGAIESVDVSQMVLADSTGKQIPIEPLDFGLDPMSDGLGFSFYTYEKGAPGALTLTIPSADFHFEQSQIHSPGFEVDFGNDPQENQEWLLDNDFDLAGYDVHLSSVKAIIQDGSPFVEFTMIGAPEITGALVLDMTVQSFGSDTASTIFRDGQVITLFKYTDGFPKGKHQFVFMLVSFNLRGNWQTRFVPASIDKQPSTLNSDFYHACLLYKDWVNRSSISEEIPSQLSGTLLIDNEFAGLIPISVTTINLTGAKKQNLVSLSQWFPGAFTPDGTVLIQYDQQAHSVRMNNLQSGEVKEYFWSKMPLNRISWSPDSAWVAYNSDDGIYISHMDGSGLYKVAGTDSETLLGGWLPDGQHLLVSRRNYKKAMLLQALDIHGGKTKDLFSFSSASATAALPSPDGKKVLFDDGIFGTQQQGIFVANPDGSERHLIASFWQMLIASYTWSPDGNWVVISVTDVGHENEMTSFLINPNSCERIRLPNLDWVVRAWSLLP